MKKTTAIAKGEKGSKRNSKGMEELKRGRVRVDDGLIVFFLPIPRITGLSRRINMKA